MGVKGNERIQRLCLFLLLFLIGDSVTVIEGAWAAEIPLLIRYVDQGDVTVEGIGDRLSLLILQEGRILGWGTFVAQLRGMICWPKSGWRLVKDNAHTAGSTQVGGQ